MSSSILTRLAAVAMVLAATLAATAHAAEGWPETVRIGYIPVEGTTVVERFGPLTEHLQNTLGIQVEAFSASDYAGIITAMGNNHIEFAYLGPKSYTEAADRAGAQAVALEVDLSGNPGYYGVIIAHRDSGITTLEGARGHQFAFTDPNSTSGYLVPNVLFFRDLQTDPNEYFGEVSFSGSHGASILAVANKSLEVAATNNIDINRAIESGQINGDEFVELWRSELIPGSPMVVRQDLPESLKAAFCGALMSFNTNEAGLQQLQISGYQPTDDSTYDVIRYLKRLKAQLAGE